MGESTLIINLAFVKPAGLEKFEVWVSEIKPSRKAPGKLARRGE
jgi:hypothetical protein